MGHALVIVTVMELEDAHLLIFAKIVLIWIIFTQVYMIRPIVLHVTNPVIVAQAQVIKIARAVLTANIWLMMVLANFVTKAATLVMVLIQTNVPVAMVTKF
jgi:hypothetical protein